jgi:hypothetical protein
MSETELQRMFLIPPKVWKGKCKVPPKRQPPPPIPPVGKILKKKDHSYNKWTKVRMLQDPLLKAEQSKREPPKPVVVEREVPLIENEEEEEYVNPKREILLNSAYGVYRDATNDSLKIGSCTFKYDDTHVFVDDAKYKATEGLWELLTKTNPNKSIVTPQDIEVYKQILLRSNAHRVNYSPRGKIRSNRGFKYTRFISRMFQPVAWTSYE